MFWITFHVKNINLCGMDDVMCELVAAFWKLVVVVIIIIIASTSLGCPWPPL
jgi:hypothetical protein